MHAHHCQADEPGSSQIAFRAVLIAEDTAQPSASLRNAGSSQRRLLVGWAHPLAPTLSDRFHHSLWRPRSGCRKRVGGSRFTPLGVCRNVVQKWRHALRVPESNPGTRDLRHLVKSASASPARRRALMRARTPPRSSFVNKRCADVRAHWCAPPLLNKCVTEWHELGGTLIPTCGSGFATRSVS
jgi:hypothetical protein